MTRATRSESRRIVPDEFVFGYLKGRAVPDAAAKSIGLEASKVFRDSPFWHATAVGRTGLLLRLHWTLLEAGQTSSQSSKLSGGLLKELLNRRIIGSDPMLLKREEVSS